MSRRAAAPTETFDVTNPTAPTFTPALDPVSMKRHIATVPIDDVGPSPLQPRQHVVESDRTELMQSIKTHGIIEPLVVRERPAEQLAAGKYTSRLELVAGEQRWTTAKRAGLTEVDVVIRELTDAHVIEFGLVENLRRTDLHPMDEAAAYERLFTMNAAYTDATLADRVGKDVSTIRKRRKLLRLVPECREAFLFNAITVKHAEKLSTIPAAQQLAALEACFNSLLMFSDAEEDEFETLEKAAPEDVVVRGSVAVLLHAKAWDKLAVSQKPVRELDEWMQTHTTADLKDTEVQTALALEPAQAAPDAEPGEVALEDPTASLLQLSEHQSYGFSPKEAKALGVVMPKHWHEITKAKDACDFAVKGVVVHGGPLRLVESVCASKKCHKHFPPAAASKSKPSVDDWNSPERREREAREREKAEEVKKAWDALKPRAYAAFAAHVAKIKITPDLVRASIDEQVDRIEKTFGIKLTPATMAQFMACAAVGSYHYYQHDFEGHAKGFGFNLKSLEAAEKASDRATDTKPAAKKAAPKKAAKAATKKPAAPKKGAARKGKKGR